MSWSFAYDDSYDPPAPVVALRVADPGGEAGVLVPGLLDTGADCTLIPPSVARQLRLPLVGHLEITGVGGGVARPRVHAGRIEIAGADMLVRLVAYENEVIVGRDVLNGIVSLLDGPSLRLRLSSAPISDQAD